MTKAALTDIVQGMVIIQDREGDIYEQFAVVPEEGVDLLIRAKSDRRLKDKTKLFSCLSDQQAQGSYEVVIDAKKGSQKRIAQMEIRFKEVEITKTVSTGKGVVGSVKLWLVEAKEVGYWGKDKVCWRLLTTIAIENVEMAKTCIEWYSWRWMIEEYLKF